MLQMLSHLMTEIGPWADWIAIFVAAVIAVFVVYVGVALWATLRCHDPGQQEIRYRVFRDLLDALRDLIYPFRRGREK